STAATRSRPTARASCTSRRASWPRWWPSSTPAGCRCASTRKGTGRSRPSWTPTPPCWAAAPGTRCGTGSSMAEPCSGRRRAGPASLGIVVAAQPGMLSILGDGFAEALPERSDELYAYASWQRAGIRVAGSSDAPVITADPLVGIRDSVLRRTSSGRVLGPAERLAARDALALYTTEAAFAMHREHDLGSLEPGKLADFVILDRSPLDVEPEQITDIQVLATVVGGQPAFQADDSPFRL